MTSEQRKENYLCDITYVTNSELGFDYLRDNLATERNSCFIYWFLQNAILLWSVLINQDQELVRFYHPC